MSFEYLIEQENKVQNLSEAEEDSLVQRICSDFDQFNNARRCNLNQAQDLSDEIFFKTASSKLSNKNNNNVGHIDNNADSKDDAWKTKVKMCKCFMLYQTLKAFIWKNVYSNVNSMFDVSGENLEADTDSNKQKSALVDIFEKMNYQQTCDKAIDYALFYGELITFCGWRKKQQQYRKQIDAEDLETNPKAQYAFNNGHFHFTASKTIYDNPYVESVNPANFVFDVSQRDDWENCPKIYKTYKNPDDVINNKYYKISDEVARELREMVQNPEANSQDSDHLEKEVVNGGTVEVLEHWGNLRLPDGRLLKNWHAVVVARKYLVRFEENSRIVNPFTYGALITDPETQRGISPIYPALSLALLQEDFLNRTADMQSLQENPPILAPEGFFDVEEVKLYPGKIIEYGDNLTPTQAFRQLEFNPNIFLNDITFMSDLMSEVTGIFPNMMGADERGNKTATEISTKAQGQLTRLSMIIDTVNQDMIIPDVEKVAKLNADFKTGEEQIFVNKGDKKETITIDDAVRKAEYRYTYADRTATTERSNKADMIVEAIRGFAEFIPLNGEEIFTWYMEQKDVENPERFLQQQDQIPIEIQQMLMQNPQIQALVQNFTQQKEAIENNGQPAEQQAPIPDASIPQAQPME